MGKYFVDLVAHSIDVNEYEVNARSPKEAEKKAIKLWEKESCDSADYYETEIREIKE